MKFIVDGPISLDLVLSLLIILIYFTQYSSSQYQASLAITQPLVDCLLNREKEFSFEVM